MNCFIVLGINVLFAICIWTVCRLNLLFFWPCKLFSVSQTLICSTYNNFQTETALFLEAEWLRPWAMSYLRANKEAFSPAYTQLYSISPAWGVKTGRAAPYLDRAEGVLQLILFTPSDRQSWMFVAYRWSCCLALLSALKVPEWLSGLVDFNRRADIAEIFLVR